MHWGRFWSQWAWFLREQALSCLFPGVLFLTFGFTKWLMHVSPCAVYRYDLILLICLVTQWGMVRAGLESRDEVKVIAVFHLLGLLLELYKTHLGCWSYPEHGWTKFYGVPLFSGFMYASVASYLCQAWRRLSVSLTRWPAAWLTVPLVMVILPQFFYGTCSAGCALADCGDHPNALPADTGYISDRWRALRDANEPGVPADWICRVGCREYRHAARGMAVP